MTTDTSRCRECPTTTVPVAICGMGMRLPGGVRDGTTLYEFLLNGRDARSYTGDFRYDAEKFYDPSGRPRTIPTKHGYWLHDIDLADFDTSMFKMSALEVERLDPQQRLLLEVVWEAMQNAGETEWQGKEIGCYVGSFREDWLQLHHSDPQDVNPHEINGSMDLALANRISYEFDLKGPSMTVKVGCSGSGICLHLACQAIAQGDCTSAVVAGSNIILNPKMQQSLNGLNIFSAEGSCKTFDASADGYARAEAVNAIFVKRLDAAIRDRNPIRAVIRATASNSDGRTPTMVRPSAEAHERLIRKAYHNAGIVDFSETAMVECHGTGTTVGDSIEATAIGRVFGEKGVYIGSVGSLENNDQVKPNLGHAEGASAINSIIKSVLSLENGVILPNIKFDKPNPDIPFEGKKLTVPMQAIPWPDSARRRISINSFGIGGSNFHIILDSAESFGLELAGSRVIPATIDGGNGNTYRLLTFSAAHPESLDRIVDSHKDYIKRYPSRLPSLQLTLLNHREHLPYRAYCVTTGLEPFQVSSLSTCRPSSQVCFVFNGQGGQWAQMGKELMEQYPSFRNDIKRMDEYLSRLEDGPRWTLEAELLKPKETSNIDLAPYAQPLSTAVQVALVNLLATWNVTPANVVGHSSGEIAAAYTAGVLNMEEATIVSYYRGRIFQDQPRRGAMVAVALGRDEISSYLKPGVAVACENSASSVTLSGDEEALETITSALQMERPDVTLRRLNVDTAYHSHHMAEIAKTYHETIAPYIRPKPPNVGFWSTVTGSALPTVESVGPKYWQTNLENPVLFSSAVTSLLADDSKNHLFLEIGPHPTLSAPLKQILRSSSLDGKCIYVPTLKRWQNSTECFLEAVGQLFTKGIDVRCPTTSPDAMVLTDLPTYPWHYERKFWHESRVMRSARLPKSRFHEILGQRTLEDNELFPTWRIMLQLGDVPWLRDHCVHHDVIFPAAAYISMAGEAVRQLTGESDYTLKDIVFHTALLLPDTGYTEIMTVFESHRLTNTSDSRWYRFTISSYDGSNCKKHCTGLACGGCTSTYPDPTPYDLPRRVHEDRFYKSLTKTGFHYGPSFRKIGGIFTGVVESMARATVIDKQQAGESQYPIHPTTLDSIFQSLILAGCKGDLRLLHQMSLPTSIEEIFVGNAAGKSIQVSSSTQEYPLEMAKGNSHAYVHGHLVLFMKGLGTRPLEASELKSIDYNVAYLQWAPDLNFQEPKSLIKVKVPNERDQVLGETLFLLCALNARQDLERASPAHPHLCKYRDWVIRQLEKASKSSNALVENSAALFALGPEDIEHMIKTIVDEGKSTDSRIVFELMLKIYNSFPRLFDGSLEPLSILLENNAWENMYNLCSKTWDYRPIFSAMGHLKPQMKILEVGGGTASLSENILQYLQSDFGEPLYQVYTFTDVSNGFLSRAKQRLEQYPNVTYQLLDITKDPEQQGLERETYDLIIASNVLHVTPSLDEALTYIRSLLRPDGRLFLQELCSSSKVINSIMGILPGWWEGENDGRVEEPYVTPEEWNSRLCKAGLSQIEALVSDAEPPYRVNATIIARPAARDAESILLEMGFQVQHVLWGNQIPPHHDIISFIELEEPLFDDIDETNMRTFLSLLNSSKNAKLLWLMKPAQVCPSDPRFALSLGMARTIRAELGITFATLELDDFTSNSSLRAVAKVFESIQGKNEQMEGFNPDMEYAYTQGSVHVGRYHWVPLLKELESRAAPDSAKELVVGKPGLLQTLEWRPRTLYELPPQGVQIKVHTAGLNFKDVLLASGIINISAETAVLGAEASGIVTAIGSEVSHVSVGDRVIALASYTSTMASEFQTMSTHCIRIPDSLGLTEAATMPCVYLTVLRALVDKAHLQKGQSVLIHSATGGVGIAAVTVARWIGAEVYASAGTDEKRAFLSRRFGIQSSHVFNSRDGKFVSQLMAVTSGRGVDVVLNSLSGELLHASWKCVASGGCMIELGKRDILGNGDLAMSPFNDNRSFIGVDLAHLAITDPLTIQRLLKELIRLYENGDIEPIAPTRKFGSMQARDAFQHLRRGQHIGKVALAIAEGDEPELAPIVPSVSFRKDASYLLIGGLGGIGRSIATWMASHGAGNLVFLSRSGGKSEDDRLFFTEIEALGCSVQIFNGDVSKKEDVEHVVCNTRRPIAGMIHTAMVLSDTAVLEMTPDKWKTAVDPKVQGVWNLHNALPDDLDLFVLLGSLSGGIGFYGQSNYAAANTFLNAFVQFRHSLNLPASVVDLGAVQDVGFVSRHPEILRRAENIFGHLISEHELLNTLQLAMTRSRAEFSAVDVTRSTSRYCNMSQIAVGLVPAATTSFVARDPRLAVYFNLRKDQTVRKQRGSIVGRFLVDAKADPTILYGQNSASIVAKEIQQQVQSLMMIEGQSDFELATLSQLGVDSLVGVELKNWWRASFGVEVTLLQLLNADSFQKLGELAVDQLKELHQREMVSTDWKSNDKQSKLPECFADSLEVAACPQVQDANNASSLPELLNTHLELFQESRGNMSFDKQTQDDRYVVILTGSTGSLGCYILFELLQIHSILKIYCLCRSDDAAGRQIRSFRLRGLDIPDGLEDRVEFIHADLPAPNLGIPDTKYEELRLSVNSIIHCAWDVNFLKPLAAFEPIHIQGFSRLLELSRCCRYRAHVHFMSSLATVLASKTPSLSPIAETPNEMPSLVWPSGYAESKYIAERMCALASSNWGIPTTIYRIGQIAGSRSGGIWNKAEWFPSLVLTSKTLGKVPRSLGPREIDWLPVDQLAKAISEIFESRSPAGASSAAVFHLVNPHKTRWESLLPVIEEKYPVEAVEFGCWLDELVKFDHATTDAKERLPLLNLLPLVRQMADLINQGWLAPLIDTKQSETASETLREMDRISPEMMKRWLQKWDF
ncbi:lovastatin diketide synthase LovF [Aspergillus lentulus]|uniref:Lovastatin diketide synthase LovF n=1 Tax=Aspergillus lentulus TaxID=293939 RepID=A0AAN4T944_ASPLE|nr:lovastatin diketide synthase LovF [Aspergillus lentulus]